MTTKVYAIQNTRSRSVKFGFSRKPLDRCAALQVANEDQLAMVGSVFGDKCHEKLVHKFLAAEHIRGEWYRGPLSDLVVAVFRRVKETVREDNRRYHGYALWQLSGTSEFGPIREMLRKFAGRSCAKVQ